MPEPLFNLGQIVATPGALDAMAKTGDDPAVFLGRHVTGDWDDLEEFIEARLKGGQSDDHRAEPDRKRDFCAGLGRRDAQGGVGQSCSPNDAQAARRPKPAIRAVGISTGPSGSGAVFFARLRRLGG